MNKKIIALIVVIILIIVAGAIYFVTQNSSENTNQENLVNEQEVNQVQENAIEEDETNTTEEGSSTSNENSILVVYFSAQGHTENVAQTIATTLGADTFEIVPVDEYTSDDLDYTDQDSRVYQEYNDESLRNVELTSTSVENWDEYDVVFIGYPIWWGNVSWPVTSFVSANDFTGKTVIPFCTSASSGIGSSDENLAETAGNGNWLDGQRFSSNVSETDVIEWVNSLGL